MTEDEMVGWHHRLNGHGFEQTLVQLKALASPAWMGGGFGGEWIHECMAESLRCLLKTTTTWFVNRLYPNTK